MIHRNTIYPCVLMLFVIMMLPLRLHAADQHRLRAHVVPAVLDGQTIYPTSVVAVKLKWQKAYQWTTLTVPAPWVHAGYYLEIWDHENHIVPPFRAQRLESARIDISSIDITRYPKIRVVVFSQDRAMPMSLPARVTFRYTVQPNIRLAVFGSAMILMMLLLVGFTVRMRISPLFVFVRETMLLLRRCPPAINLRQAIIYCWLTILWAGVFGVVLGLFNGGLQIAYLLIKLPFLLLGTLLLTITTNVVLTMLLGISASLKEMVVRSLAIIATIALGLAAFVPLILFYLWYPFEHDALLVAAMVIFTLSALFGAFRFYEQLSRARGKLLSLLVTLCWVAVYGVTLMQLGWMLRPWVGVRDPVTNSVPFSRLYSGNVVVEILQTGRRLNK